METKAHYVLVGFFAVALAAASALFAVWLGKASFDREFADYDVVFQGPVRGLSTASAVRFNGIEVGEVTALGLDPDDPTLVIARIRVRADTPFRESSVARLEPQGLTGLNYIQVSAGDLQSSRLIDDGSGGLPRLQSERAAVETLLQGSENIVDDVSIIVQSLRTLFDEETVGELRRTVQNLSAISEELREERVITERARVAVERLERAAAEMEAAGTSVNTFAVEADRLLREDLGPMVRETELAAIGVNQASLETLGLLEDIRDPMARFSDTGLDEITLTVAELRRLVATLETLAAEIEDDPAAFVSGPRRQEVEIPR